MKSKKIIGILGGMGPAASSYLYSYIVHAMQQTYHAVQDQDFPQVLLNSVGINGFNEQGDITALGAKHIIQEAKRLETAGAELLIIACNTAHVIGSEIQSSLSIPLVSLVKTTVEHVGTLGIKKVGVLSSETSAKHDLYGTELAKYGICCVHPTIKQKHFITKVILSVMSGTHTDHELFVTESIAYSLFQQGAECIILGCTELPLLFARNSTSLYVDPMRVTVQKVLASIFKT